MRPRVRTGAARPLRARRGLATSGTAPDHGDRRAAPAQPRPPGAAADAQVVPGQAEQAYGQQGGLHVMLSPYHVQVADRFVADLGEALAATEMAVQTASPISSPVPAAAAAGANAAGGSRHAQFQAADHSRLHASLTLTRLQNPRDVFFLRGETFFSLGEYHQSLGPEDPLAAIPKRSHGQGIMLLARERLGPESLVILDEPEDGLSVFAQLELLGLLTVLVRRGAQVLMATHSPVLLAVPGARIVGVPTLEPVLYDACEPVTATGEFIDDPGGTAQFLVGP